MGSVEQPADRSPAKRWQRVYLAALGNKPRAGWKGPPAQLKTGIPVRLVSGRIRMGIEWIIQT